MLGSTVCATHGGKAPQVMAAARRRLELAAITKNRTLLEIGRIAFMDGGSFLHDDGSLKTMSELNDDQRAALAAFEVLVRKSEDGGAEDRIHRYRFWDKLKALEILARHFGLLEKENSGPGVIEIRWQQPQPKVSEAKAIEIPASVAPEGGE